MFVHCMTGWRAVFCVLDNLVPHRADGSGPDNADLIGRGPFRMVCWLHGRAMR